METLAFRDLSFCYPGGTPALDGVTLTVEAGDFFVLCGPSGCGKSTLLRQCKSVLTPHGRRSGEVLFYGKALDSYDQRQQSQRIGFVQQSPEDQLVTDKVWHELAFGLESLGRDTPTIRRRVAEMAAFFGIQDWFDRDVASLSGGQKQLLNLAAVMTLDPDLLILDEPTSQLDPIAAADFLSVLARLNRDLGVTVLLTEHRLEDALPLASRAAVLDRGRLLAAGTPREAARALREQNHPMFWAMPTPLRVWAVVGDEQTPPLTVREGRDWLDRYAAGHRLEPLPEERIPTDAPEAAITCKELFFRYEKNGPDVLQGLSLEVHRGEFLALLGGNGAGKSTLLKLLAGLGKPYRGTLALRGSVAAVAQDPKALFVKSTLRADLLEVCKDGERVARIAALCQLDGLLDRHPFDLSGGERQRAALSKVLLLEPDILLLDEPTKGLDAHFKQVLAGILQRLTDRGVTILMVSHDVEFCAAYAHRCALLFHGSIVTQGPPRAFFSGNAFYTTAANRMGRGLVPGAVTADDLIAACGGQVPKPPAPPKSPDRAQPLPPAQSTPTTPRNRRRVPRRTRLAAGLILLLIPLTLLVGARYLEGRRYYFISLLVLLEAMAPFFLVFEGRRPQARELVVIAVLCAIAVAGRAAFFMLPQCKPVLALTVIAGAALGGESGFLVGSMTMLVSNALFAPGPWTPWQMFAMGLCGFLAGLLFRKGALPRSKGVLCCFGAACAIVIYGGILNTSSALLWVNTVNWQTLLASWTVGFPMDCIHAAATAVFLWLAALPMLEKLERVRIKYGLVS